MRAIIDGLKQVPRTCTWELTLRCHLRCGHCGSRAGQARANEMPREVALRTLEELAALGCAKISLSGGEPTLSPYWEELASEGSRLGMNMNMIVSGASGGKDLARRAREAGLQALGVSLDGLEATHDRNRGSPGLYRRVLDLLEECAAVGLPAGVITTVWKGNLRELEALHDLLVGKVYVWQLQLGAAMGNLADHRVDQIVPEDLLTLVPQLSRLVQREELNVFVADNIGYYGPYEEILRKRRSSPVSCWVGCYAGCRHIGIESDGGVKGCLSIQSTRATEGNVQRESLLDLWRREGAFAYNRHFKVEDLGGFCRTCEHASVCRGGCLSMRTCEGGENPFCYHRVATLAERLAERRVPRYVPMAIAPAALLAAFGIGCGGTSEEPTTVLTDSGSFPDNGNPPTDASKEDSPSPEAQLYGLPGDAYGLPWWDATDAPEAEPDGPIPGDAYGIIMPDSDVEDADAGSDAPSDVESDIVDFYGMPPKY